MQHLMDYQNEISSIKAIIQKRKNDETSLIQQYGEGTNFKLMYINLLLFLIKLF